MLRPATAGTMRAKVSESGWCGSALHCYNAGLRRHFPRIQAAVNLTTVTVFAEGDVERHTVY